MDIASYQQWFAEYDRQRSFDLIDPSQVVVHLVEEVGEIAREILYLEGYRDPNDRQDAIARLSAEIGDAFVFLTKLAIQYDIRLEDVIQGIITKAEDRWPTDVAQREMARYIEQQQAHGAERTTTWRRRNPTSHIGDTQS